MKKKIDLPSKISSEWNNPSSPRVAELILLIKWAFVMVLVSVLIQVVGEFLVLKQTESNLILTTAICIKILFPIALGVLCSLIATFFWELRNSANEKVENKKLYEAGLFKAFFRSSNDFGIVDSFDIEKTVFVLPGFSPKILASDIDVAKRNFFAANEKEFPYRKNTKELGFPKKRSFTQSDIICTANVVALYKSYNMVLPFVRTDIQGLYKFFQFSEGARLDNKEVYERIKAFLPEENAVWNKESIISDIANSSNRKYSTYIVIGLFSNIFLMDFLNTHDDIPGKHFRLLTKQKLYSNSSFDLVRTVEIIDEHGVTVETPREMLITDDAEGDDYALIARFEYEGKSIFVIGGGHSQGTEFASIKLSQMWEVYMEKFENNNFAIVYQLSRTQRINEAYVSNSNTYTSYPHVTF